MKWRGGGQDADRIRTETHALMDAGLQEPYVRSDGMPGLRRTASAAAAGFPKPVSQQAGDPDGKE